MKKLLLTLAGCCLTAGFTYAQDSNQLLNILVKHWETSKEFSIAVANAMPADQYSAQPAPPEKGFGAMVNHIASANGFYCSVALGSENPIGKTTDDSKDAAIKNLTKSYDYCIDGLKKMSEADLMKTRGKAPRQMTAFEAFWGAFTHSAHHRSQLEVFLRLKGQQPPNYKF
jgi:Uncharacterized protein conserved in bacteria